MKFLVVTKSKHPIPPEVISGMIEATLAWKRKYEGRIEQAWGFAETQGGGGIVEVESLEELNVMLTEFPLGPFSELQVHGLVDLEASFERLKLASQAMTSGAPR